MKKLIKYSSNIIVAAFMLVNVACYSYTVSHGNGAQSGAVVKAKNHYLIAGLATLKTVDPAELAGDTQDYDLTVEHTFVDGLLAFITGGIYTPTTVKIQK